MSNVLKPDVSDVQLRSQLEEMVRADLLGAGAPGRTAGLRHRHRRSAESKLASVSDCVCSTRPAPASLDWITPTEAPAKKRLPICCSFQPEGGSKRNCQSVVRVAEGIDNDSEIHAGLLLYKAKALRKLRLLTAARETLTETLRRKKDRSDELLRALRYERALVYGGLGWDKRYRKTLETLYAEDVDYEDVAARLRLSV